MTRLVGAQGQVNLAKKAKICPIVTSPPENPKPWTKKNVSTSTSSLAESVEDLNSSTAQSDGEL